MNKKIYLVGNSHIDPVWLWNYREGIDEVLSTFKSACDRQGGYLIWNTLSRPVKGAFEIEAMLPKAHFPQKKSNTFIDKDGRVVPYQVAPGINSVSGPTTKVIIDEIPAKGYRLYYYVKKREGINHFLNLQKIRKIETKKYRIRLGLNGLPASIYSKLIDQEILSGPVKLLVLNDSSDTWGHGVKSYNEVAGQFKPEEKTFATKGGLFSAVYANLRYAGGGKTKIGRKKIFKEPTSLSRAFVET